MKKCKFCGGEFEGAGQKKYCSIKCWQADYRRLNKQRINKNAQERGRHTGRIPLKEYLDRKKIPIRELKTKTVDELTKEYNIHRTTVYNKLKKHGLTPVPHTNKCKRCGVEFNSPQAKKFCSVNCYHLWKYHNSAEINQKAKIRNHSRKYHKLADACELCSSTEKLQWHHMKYTMNPKDWATLCEDCHKMEKRIGKKKLNELILARRNLELTPNESERKDI